ncbi:hypothetical protein EDC01DRAFT_634733 [Geopyxis carbonaria]|nr:hypothetical protein EDC01DRAFT_634733 [Geopyxis carbonaria]
MAYNILQRERLYVLPYIVIQNKNYQFLLSPHEKDTKTTKIPRRHTLRYELPDLYPENVLLAPSETRLLTPYERARLKDFYYANTDLDEDDWPNFIQERFKIWGKAIAGRQLKNESHYELVSSSFAMDRLSEKSRSTRRDDSHVRYMATDPSGDSYSYFGQVRFYTTLTVECKDSTDTYMLAYIQYLCVCRVHPLELAYKLNPGPAEFIELTDIQELVGRIYSRGKEFFVSKKSCFWPHKGHVWDQTVDKF